MIHLSQTVIVEGKYDKIKLKNFLDAEIITTDGFAIFKNREKRELIQKIAKTRGIVVLTDSDSAGFLIRGHLLGLVPKECVVNVFVPEIKGKEKRKVSPSAEGLLGVEGLSEAVLTEAFKRAGLNVDVREKQPIKEKITHGDFFALGLSGKENSREARLRLEERLKLPKGMSTNQLLTALNSLMSREEFIKLMTEE